VSRPETIRNDGAVSLRIPDPCPRTGAGPGLDRGSDLQVRENPSKGISLSTIKVSGILGAHPPNRCPRKKGGRVRLPSGT